MLQLSNGLGGWVGEREEKEERDGMGRVGGWQVGQAGTCSGQRRTEMTQNAIALCPPVTQMCPKFGREMVIGARLLKIPRMQSGVGARTQEDVAARGGKW